MNRLRIALIVLLAMGLAVPACAAEEGSVRLGAQAGYGGTVLYTRDMPIIVSLENQGADFSGTVSVDVYASEMDFDRYEASVQLAAGAAKRMVLPVTPGYRQEEFRVDLRDAAGNAVASTVARTTRGVGQNALLVGTLSSRQQQLAYWGEESEDIWNAQGNILPWVCVSLDAQNFPAEARLLDAFQILVLDGFDARTLTDAQQQTLRGWLLDGGICVVSGGAQAALGYPFFEEYTGVAPGALSEKTGVLEALLAFAQAGENEEDASEPASAWPSVVSSVSEQQKTIAGQQQLPAGWGKVLEGETAPEDAAQADALMVNELPGAQAEGNLLFCPAEDGLVVLTSYELGARAVANAAEMPGLWRKLLRAGAEEAYTAAETSAQGVWESNQYGWNDALSSLPVENAHRGWPLAALLALYLLLAGIVLYLVLKRMDKREWMWLGVPVLAVLAALGVLKTGEHLGFDRPMAATGLEIVYQADGEADANLYTVLSSPETGEFTVASEPGVRLLPYGDDSAYYYYSEGNEEIAPTRLRYRYILSGTPAVAYPGGSSWSARHLRMEDERAGWGQLEGSAWMEEDGLHMEIANRTPGELRDVIVYSDLGFAHVPSIAQGETANLLLRRADGQEEEQIADWLRGLAESSVYDGSLAEDLAAYEGVLLPMPVQAGGFQSDAILSAALGGTLQASPQPRAPGQVDLSAALGGALQGQEPQNRQWELVCTRAYETVGRSFDVYGAPFAVRVLCRVEGVDWPQLSLNGQEIARTSRLCVAAAELTYAPIGPDGYAYYPAGEVNARLLDMEAAFDPENPLFAPESQDAAGYYELPYEPAFLFDLGARVEPQRLYVAAQGYYNVLPIASLYNFASGEWDVFELPDIDLAGAAAAPYVSAQGYICVRYAQAEETEDWMSSGTGSVNKPALVFEGRVAE